LEQISAFLLALKVFERLVRVRPYFIFKEGSFINSPICESHLSPATFETVMIVALIHLSIFPLFPAFSLLVAFKPSSFINGLGGVYVSPMEVPVSIFEEANINIAFERAAVCEDFFASSMGLTVKGLTFVEAFWKRKRFYFSMLVRLALKRFLKVRLFLFDIFQLN
jgi:hypothetical protein